MSRASITALHETLLLLAGCCRPGPHPLPIFRQCPHPAVTVEPGPPITNVLYFRYASETAPPNSHFIVQSAPTPDGPWTNFLYDPPSTFTVFATNPAQFFRVLEYH